MASQENVLTHTYDLLLYLIPQLAKYPRTQKFMLADRIEVQILDLLEMLLEAYYGDKTGRKAILKQANIQLEKIRYLIRLSKDLECIDVRRYEIICKKVDDIGRQVGSWLKSLV